MRLCFLVEEQYRYDGIPLDVIRQLNAFPGIRGQAGAPETLAELALRAAAAGSSVRGTGLQDRPRTAAVLPDFPAAHINIPAW